MALCLSSTSLRQHQALPNPSTISTPSRLISNQTLPFTIHLRRSSPLFAAIPYRFPGLCRAASPGGPPPPESDPPTGEESTQSEGPVATLARMQDTMQIFFAVLFWMSLFFWASAWDGRNNGRPGKGSRF